MLTGNTDDETNLPGFTLILRRIGRGVKSSIWFLRDRTDGAEDAMSDDRYEVEPGTKLLSDN